MNIKCKYCGASIDRTTAFKIVNNAKNEYFCSDEHYKAQLTKLAQAHAEKAEYDEIYETTKLIFGYDFTGYSLLKREVMEWEKVADRKKIISYLTENKDKLSGILGRVSFANDFCRVRYYSKVVASNLHDFSSMVVETPILVQPKAEDDVGIHINRKSKTSRRQGFSEGENDI